MAHRTRVRRSLGVRAMVEQIAQGMPSVVRVLDALLPVRFPIRPVTHRELRTARRIRRVFDLRVGAPAAPAAQAAGRPGAVARRLRPPRGGFL